MFDLAADHPGEAFQSGEVHSRRKSRSHCDQDDPEQPEADAHLIARMAPRCKRQVQGRAKSSRALLGQVTGRIDLPCAVSVPNRSANRALLLSGWGNEVDVR